MAHVASLMFLLAATTAFPQAPYLGNGAKVGEVGADAAIVWVRLTQTEHADFGRLPILTQGLGAGEKDVGEMPVDLLPGAAGEVRVRWWPAAEARGAARATDWAAVSPERDHTLQIRLAGLSPGTRYAYQIEARASGGAESSVRTDGFFHTAPRPEAAPPVRFIVTTCQAIRSVDSGRGGHFAYARMLEFEPHFFVHTGDILYYDKAPLAKSVPQARAKWNLMFAYDHNRHFHQQVSSYFMKDDHDTLKNDCWPGQTYGDLSFEQGLEIFREQVPMGEKTYRTYRWGRDVQIWMTENRDFRSPNHAADGPGKTILGEEQKAWLKRTLGESDATHKFVISPGPIVGPDKKGKRDNHSNEGFRHEGRELREFLSALPNTYVICGDRHWQYVSRDPQTGLVELGCGPINDQHNYGGHPGRVPEFHEFFSHKGGFLGITVGNGKAKAEYFGVDPDAPSEVRFSRALGR